MITHYGSLLPQRPHRNQVTQQQQEQQREQPQTHPHPLAAPLHQRHRQQRAHQDGQRL